MQFPAVAGDNLSGEHLVFPAAFRKRTIVLVAFDLEQRADLETWVGFVDRHVRSGHIEGRVFAVIAQAMKLLKPMILATMRKAAPSDAARAAMVPLFTDVDAFCTALEIVDRTSIVVYVVEPGGVILARRNGAWNDAAAQAIGAFLAQPA